MANYSAVDICNMALAMVGGKMIRSLDEDNKRARLCNVFYPMTRDYLLARFDWPFARKIRVLRQLTDEDLVRYAINLDTDIPEGWYAYAKPSDCLAARDIEPPGNREKWMEMKGCIMVPKPPEVEVSLRYTAENNNTGDYSMQFISMLSIGVASYLAPAMVGAETPLTQTLLQRWMAEQAIGFGDDANIGEVPDPDGNPRLDTFSDPDMVNYTALSPLGSVDYNNT